MKKNNLDKKTLIITVLLCLLPIIYGTSVADRLPDLVAIHWNFEGVPDNFVNKNFAIFLLPIFMAIMQAFTLILYNFKINQVTEAYNKEHSKEYNFKTINNKFLSISNWIIPIMTNILYFVTIQIALGKNIDVRIICMLIVGIIFIISGNYIPKMNYEECKDLINPRAKSEKAFRIITRFTGYSFVICGLLCILSIFFTYVLSIVALAFIFLSSIIMVIITYRFNK